MSRNAASPANKNPTNNDNKRLFLNFKGISKIVSNLSKKGNEFRNYLLRNLPKDKMNCIKRLESHCKDLKSRKTERATTRNVTNLEEYLGHLHRVSDNSHDLECMYWRYTICKVGLIGYMEAKTDTERTAFKSTICRGALELIKDAEHATEYHILFVLLHTSFELFFIGSLPDPCYGDDLLTHLKLAIDCCMCMGVCREELQQMMKIAVGWSQRLQGKHAAKLYAQRIELEYVLRFTENPERKARVAAQVDRLNALFCDTAYCPTLEIEIYNIGRLVPFLFVRDVLENETLSQWIFRYHRHCGGYAQEYIETVVAAEELVIHIAIYERYKSRTKPELRREIEKLIPNGCHRQKNVIDDILDNSTLDIFHQFYKILNTKVDLQPRLPQEFMEKLDGFQKRAREIVDHVKAYGDSLPTQSRESKKRKHEPCQDDTSGTRKRRRSSSKVINLT